jgi:maleamate amidohydrolase
MNDLARESADDVYKSKGFGAEVRLMAPFGLLLVDFCIAFVERDELGGGNISRAAANSESLLMEARVRGWAVAHSQIVFDSTAAPTPPWTEKVPALTQLTNRNPASAFVASLQPREGEHVVRKQVPSAFFQSDLDCWLRGKGVATLLIAGCTTSGCVRASAVDAISHHFRPVVISDCVGDRSLAAHEASLSDLGAKYANISDWSVMLDLVRSKVFR